MFSFSIELNFSSFFANKKFFPENYLAGALIKFEFALELTNYPF